MNAQIITFLYAAGIIQSMILGLVIVKKKKLRLASNQILLGLLITISIVLVQYVLIVNRSSLSNRFLGELGTISWFAIGPLFYLYASSQSTPTFRFKRWHALLFVFPIYNLLQYLGGLVQSGLTLYFIFDNGVIYSYAWLMAYLVHTLGFVIVSILVLRSHTKEESKSLIRFFYLWMLVLVSATTYLIASMNSKVYFFQLEMYLVVIFDVFVLMLTFRSLLATTAFDTQIETSTKELKYSNSGLSKKELQELHSQLVTVMETEKPYMDRKLNLAGLAGVSGIRENQLSQIFSQFLQSSFYDFISQYRLREVELRLNDPKYAHLKIISLAEDCGFNSKAAFYKTFKEKHQLTPTQYLKERKAS
jgi:AraC-like DNA-binding protein